MLVRDQVQSTTGIPRAVSSIKLLDVLLKILSTWDLETTTAGSVRRHLEKDFGADLSDPKYRIIKEKIDVFFEEGEEDENEGKGRGRRKRKRKRKEKEICIVSPQLQDIVGEGPEMARAKAVKKIVAYGREKGLHKNKSIIYIDDKLEALFPGRRSIHIFRIDNLLAKNSHIQPLKVMKLCKECKVRRTRTRRENETCECDQIRVKSQRKDIQQKHNLAEEDIRSWDTLPHDILVKIIDILCGPLEYWTPISPAFSTRYASVSRSWKLAVLDLVFPPSDVLDLRVLDSHPWKSCHKMFFHYLRIAFKCLPTSAWTTVTTLHFPNETIFAERPFLQNNTLIIKNGILTLIAEKTPELRNLILPNELWNYIFSKLAPNWKNLRKVRIFISAYNFVALQANCKFICELNLYGLMDENLASMLAKFFPNLKSLEIRGCTMSNHVLRIISDGHKNLELLDTQPNFYHFAEAHVESSSKPEMSGIIKQKK
ncbi:hypothetical protein ABKV19_006890 [Rosa sericea]